MSACDCWVGTVEGSLYYFPYENGCETLPAAEEATVRHHVHTFDMTQRPTGTQVGPPTPAIEPLCAPNADKEWHAVFLALDQEPLLV